MGSQFPHPALGESPEPWLALIALPAVDALLPTDALSRLLIALIIQGSDRVAVASRAARRTEAVSAQGALVASGKN